MLFNKRLATIFDVNNYFNYLLPQLTAIRSFSKDEGPSISNSAPLCSKMLLNSSATDNDMEISAFSGLSNANKFVIHVCCFGNRQDSDVQSQKFQ